VKKKNSPGEKGPEKVSGRGGGGGIGRLAKKVSSEPAKKHGVLRESSESRGPVKRKPMEGKKRTRGGADPGGKKVRLRRRGFLKKGIRWEEAEVKNGGNLWGGGNR